MKARTKKKLLVAKSFHALKEKSGNARALRFSEGYFPQNDLHLANLDTSMFPLTCDCENTVVETPHEIGTTCHLCGCVINFPKD